MQYLRARYYSPETGRFIQKDEYNGDFAKPETLNRYAYCSGNPVLYSDPSGYVVNIIAGVVGAVGGAIIGAATEVVPKLISGEEIDWTTAGARAAGGAIVGGVSGLTFGAAAVALSAGELSAITIGSVSAETLISTTISSMGMMGLAGMAGSAVRQGIETGDVDLTTVSTDGLLTSITAGLSTYLYGATLTYPYTSVSSGSCTVTEDVAVAGDNTVPIAGKITGYTTHGLNQALGRDGGRGVASDAILDAVRSPMRIVVQDREYGTVYKYIGTRAVVILNEMGKVVTTYATTRSGWRIK